MKKEEFLAALSYQLRDLQPYEINRICDYYFEYISDAVDSGQDEQQVVASLGDPAALAYKLKTEQSFENAKKNPKASNVAKVLIAVLGVLAFPIAFPVAIAVIAVAFALLIAVICIGAALLVALFAAVFATGGMFVQAIAAVPQSPAASIFMIGLALAAVGVLMLALLGLFVVGRKFVKWLISLCQRFINWAFKKRR